MSLLGKWVIDPDDARRTEIGDIRLDFSADGALTYVIRGLESDQIIKLRYRVEGAVLVTDQPSAPQIERTAFSLSPDGVLTLAFGGLACRFRRAEAAEQH